VCFVDAFVYGIFGIFVGVGFAQEAELSMVGLRNYFYVCFSVVKSGWVYESEVCHPDFWRFSVSNSKNSKPPKFISGLVLGLFYDLGLK